jgi:antitoxin ParD1/3/4
MIIRKFRNAVVKLIYEETMMMQLNVSLPEPIYDWVQSQAISAHFSNSGDYVRELIMQMQKLQALQKSITEGLESDVSCHSVAEIVDQTKPELQIIEKERAIYLTTEDMAFFFNALENSPKANSYLKRAAQRHQQLIQHA